MTATEADTEVGTYAKIVADSVSPHGHRLTTMEVRFHRFVLAEFNTHRVFSRNSASSRAIPFRKVVQRIQDAPALPLEWASEQKGMQGGEAVADTQAAEDLWLSSRAAAVRHAEELAELGVHKSLVNRLLEPYASHTAIITATDWIGFFDQRCSPLAQPEIRVAAEMMRAVYLASTPVEVGDNEWHLPYIGVDDLPEADLRWPEDQAIQRMALAHISAARCARVSYLTHDGRRDLSADLELYDRLVLARPPHFSPLEHVATPWGANAERRFHTFKDLTGQWRHIERFSPRLGNLLGWRQLRLEVEAAQTDSPNPFGSREDDD